MRATAGRREFWDVLSHAGISKLETGSLCQKPELMRTGSKAEKEYD